VSASCTCRVSVCDCAFALAAMTCHGAPVLSLGRGEPWQVMAANANAQSQTETLQVHDADTGRIWEILVSGLADAPSVAERRVLFIARDVTKLVELEKSLRESEKMSVMGTLVAGVAHEVRNPLFGISAALDALEAVLDSRAASLDCIRVLRQQTARMNHLMNALLNYGKASRDDRSRETIDGVIRDAMDACQEKAKSFHVGIRSHIDDDLPPIWVDRPRVVQVFQNLIDNALEFSLPETTVIVSAGNLVEDGKRWIQCVVRDHGPGFHLEDLPRVFDPFYSRRKNGTGLGLSIVKRIVGEHGGWISICNTEEGAQVAVRFPVERRRGGGTT